MRSCFFTGHRTVVINSDIYTKLSNELHIFAESGVTDFYAGGAVGWDTLCAGLVLSVRESGMYPDVKLHLILPCPFEIQSAKWSEELKEECRKIYNAADSVEIVSPIYTKDCMKKRNARLADSGEICLCYFNETHKRSGTAQTVRMARERGVKMINYFAE